MSIRRQMEALLESMEGSLSADQVADLPVGSIVWSLGDSRAWVVNKGGVILPGSVLPEKATGHYPGDGEKPGSVSSEFSLISKGKGKMPTAGTVQKAAMKFVYSQNTRLVK